MSTPMGTPAHRVELRNPAIASAFETALRGDAAPLITALSRASRLPGPRPNITLAQALAARIVDTGPRGERVAKVLAAAGPSVAPAESPAEFVPCCAAYAFAALWQRHMAQGAQGAGREAFDALAALAEDGRLRVRTAVVDALVWVARNDADRLVEALASFMNGYLSAAAALEALRGRAVLDGLRAPAPLLARLGEAFSLLRGAARADQRSHGYRSALRAFREMTCTLIERYPAASITWLEEHLPQATLDLHEAIEGAFASAAPVIGKSGDFAARLRVALDAGTPRRRDPTTYVGPTRERSAKHGRAPRKSKLRK